MLRLMVRPRATSPSACAADEIWHAFLNPINRARRESQRVLRRARAARPRRRASCGNAAATSQRASSTFAPVTCSTSSLSHATNLQLGICRARRTLSWCRWTAGAEWQSATFSTASVATSNPHTLIDPAGDGRPRIALMGAPTPWGATTSTLPPETRARELARRALIRTSTAR